MQKSVRNTVFFLCSFFTMAGLAQAPVIDSLLGALKTSKADTSKVNILFSLSDKLWRIGEMDTAMVLAKEGVALAENLNYKKGLASCMASVGLIHWQKGNYPEGLTCQLKALKIREGLNDQKGIASCYNNIGNIYWNQQRFDDALVFHKKSLAIREKLNDKIGMAGSYNNIGILSIEKNNYPEALACFLRSVEIREKLGDKSGMATAFNNIGIVYINDKKPEKALEYYNRSLKIREEIGDKHGIANSMSSIGAVLFEQKKFKASRECEVRALEIAKQLGNKRQMTTAFMRLAKLDSAADNFKSAYENYKLNMLYRDSMINEANTKKSVEAAMNYEFEKKEATAKAEQEKKDAVAEADKQRQKVITWSIVGILLLVAVFAVFVYRSYLQKQKANKELDEKNKSIAEQKKLVEDKNILITDSIEYAKSIQDVILPTQALLNEWLDGHFVFFKPKDLVSGDFYWAKPINNKIFVAVIDCTGHGVPGAFMSLMAFNMLENIIIKKEFSQPSLILDELNAQVVSILHQQTENASAKYGMDITLIEIDKKTNKVEFAGAHNSLLIVHAGEGGKREEVKADKTTIGMAREKFTNHTRTLQKGDMLYMFTDGYPDQRGGPSNKKFFALTFRELLASVSNKEPAEQRAVLDKTLTNWMGKNEQIDDILVMGIRV